MQNMCEFFLNIGYCVWNVLIVKLLFGGTWSYLGQFLEKGTEGGMGWLVVLFCIFFSSKSNGMLHFKNSSEFLYKGKYPETLLIQSNGQYPQILNWPFLKLTFIKAEMMSFRTAHTLWSIRFSTWAAKCPLSEMIGNHGSLTVTEHRIQSMYTNISISLDHMY